MGYLKKHPAPLIAVIGAVLAGQSVAWEYARVTPSYRFIVEPWSVRGYDLVQGSVVATIAACIGILVVIAWLDVATDRKVPQVAVGAAFIGVTIGIAAAAGSKHEIILGTLAGIAISLAAGIITTALVKNLLGSRLEGRNRQALVYGGPLTLAVACYVGVIAPFFLNEPVTFDVWVLAALVVTPLVLLAVVGQPRELATNRLLILAVVAGWAFVTLSAGAVRTVLIELQQEAGAAAQYKDVQITSGLILAFTGMGLAFLGSVAMWAQRRDQLIALRRAQQQRDAAEKSAAELAEALEMLDPEYR